MGFSLRDRMKRMRPDNILLTRFDALITLVNQLSVVQRGQNHHKIDDTIVVTTVDSFDLASNATLINDIKAKYNTHRVATSFHPAADATNTLATADQTDLATGIALANAFKAAFNAHLILMTSHITKDDAMTVVSTNASDLPTLLVLTRECKATYNMHVNRTHHPAATAAVVTVDAAP